VHLLRLAAAGLSNDLHRCGCINTMERFTMTTKGFTGSILIAAAALTGGFRLAPPSRAVRTPTSAETQPARPWR